MPTPITLPALPQGFIRRIVTVYPEEGPAWLKSLPELVSVFESEWSLRLDTHFPNLSYNYVAPGLKEDGTAVVLKLGPPSSETGNEIDALQLDGGRGYARLLASDRERGALLIERLLPGEEVPDLDDKDGAVAIATTVMRRIWHPPPAVHSFPTIGDWAEGLKRLRVKFDGGTGPLPTHLVERAEDLFKNLLPTSAEPVVLHGDLHHFNILSAQREPWLAIDPKGVVGEPAYEVGAWLRNPIPRIHTMPDLRAIEARRLDQFSELLGFDRQRLRDWGIAQAVLSGWWSAEDHDEGWEPAFAIAEALAAI